MGGLVNAVGSLFGGGNNNSQTTAAGVTSNILNPSTVQQATDQYGNVVSGLNQQQNLINALQAQGGIGNQTNILGQQQQLANALQAQAQGQGPNPAQAALAQNTGQNVANQAALMAGQRGSAQNVGLAGKNIAAQGAATQQNAVGQAATLGAQQQLNAQQQLAAQQQAMQGVAGTQVANQANAVSGYNQAAQGAQANILNSINAQNNANVGLQSNINAGNMAMSQTNANNSANMVGGMLNSAIAPIAGIKLAKGGIVPDHIHTLAHIYHGPGAIKMAYGGVAPTQSMPQDVGGSSYAIQNVSPLKQMPKDKAPVSGLTGPENTAGDATGGGLMAGGAEDVGGGAMGGAGAAAAGSDALSSALPLIAMAAKKGGTIPGKAKVKGDSEKNDTVPILASPGETVLPRSVMNSKDPAQAAYDFVNNLSKSQGKSSEKNDFKESLKKAIGARKK